MLHAHLRGSWIQKCIHSDLMHIKINIQLRTKFVTDLQGSLT